MNKPTKLYLVWEEDDSMSAGGYFNQYDTLTEAVQAYRGQAEIYVANIKRLGQFKMQTKCVRVKSRKKKVNKSELK